MSELTVEFHGVIWNSNELNQLKEYIYEVRCSETEMSDLEQIWKLHLRCA
ncbi:MAG: hypothetical protein ACKO8Q_07255 [Bacteroidota bacterium]